MSPTVTLTLIKGSAVTGEYIFTDPAHCVVGRAVDCDICVPADAASRDVSRHHCTVDVEPPVVRVRDLGSLNGTFVNGVRVGSDQMARQEEVSSEPDTVELHPGDEVRLGRNTALRLSVFPPPEYVLVGAADLPFSDPARET